MTIARPVIVYTVTVVTGPTYLVPKRGETPKGENSQRGNQ